VTVSGNATICVPLVCGIFALRYISEVLTKEVDVLPTRRFTMVKPKTITKALIDTVIDIGAAVAAAL